jgi:DNA (cytosine-5)-methyltransferase 1
MPIECERLQGFPEDWTLPDDASIDVDRMDSLRYTAIGNAVTVPVAEWLGTRIAEYLAKSQRSASPKTEAVAVARVGAAVADRRLGLQIAEARQG